MLDTRPFDPSVIITVMPALIPFLAVTLLIGVVSIVLGSLLGGLLAWGRLGGNRLAGALSCGYVYVIRCTPAIVLLFVVFYGLPKLMAYALGFDMDDAGRAVFAVITFSLLFGAYVSEVFRSAYLAVEEGQYEAAVATGLSPVRAVVRIVLPQAAVVALPNFGNAVIELLKESALAYTIGVIDLIGEAGVIISRNFGAYGIEIYLAAMLIYWVMSIGIEKSFLLLEKRLSRNGSIRMS